MKTTLAVLSAVALLCGSVTAYPNDRRAECKKVKEKIRQIEARMRQGYSAKQGIRFDERLRELKRKRYKVCR